MSNFSKSNSSQPPAQKHDQANSENCVIHFRLVESGGLQIIGKEGKVLMLPNSLGDGGGNFNGSNSISQEPVVWANPKLSGHKGGSKDNSDSSSVWLLAYPIIKNQSNDKGDIDRDNEFQVVLKHGFKNPMLVFKKTLSQQSSFIVTSKVSEGSNNRASSIWRI